MNRNAKVLDALQRALPAVEYVHEHEGCAETLKAVKLALSLVEAEGPLAKRASEEMDVIIVGFDYVPRDEAWMEQLAEAKPIGDLPPEDPDCSDPSNEHRAGWAGLALKTFSMATGSDLEDAVADLIADMAHWCDRHGLDIAREIDRARGMYGDETRGEGAQFDE